VCNSNKTSLILRLLTCVGLARASRWSLNPISLEYPESAAPCRIVASSGARSLSMVTLSGSQVQGADLLVVAQSCKNLSTLSIKRCALDQSVLESLQNRGIVIDVTSPQTQD